MKMPEYDSVIDGNLASTPLKGSAATSMKVAKVRDLAGRVLVSITDMVPKMVGGMIEFGAMMFGGLLAIGSKGFAVPNDVISIETVHYAVLLYQGEEVPRRPPGFDRYQWSRTNAHQVMPDLANWSGFMAGGTGNRY